MTAQVITRPGTWAVPFDIDLGASDQVTPSAIFASYDGSGAATAFLPCITYYTQDGLVLARSFPDATVAAGAAADVSWFPAATAVAASSSSAGSATPYRLISLASTNGASVKAAPGSVWGWFLSNQNAATRYVKLYNTAAVPTVGTTVPALTIAVPGGASANVGFSTPVGFGAGIGVGITTGVADNDTGAVAANELVVNLLYS